MLWLLLTHMRVHVLADINQAMYEISLLDKLHLNICISVWTQLSLVHQFVTYTSPSMAWPIREPPTVTDPRFLITNSCGPVGLKGFNPCGSVDLLVAVFFHCVILNSSIHTDTSHVHRNSLGLSKMNLVVLNATPQWCARAKWKIHIKRPCTQTLVHACTNHVHICVRSRC